MTLFGTAVGAGILFLPITAGIAGILVLLIVMLISIPAVYFSHINISMMLSEATENVDYSGAINEFMGKKSGFWINIIFFITLFLLLIVYSSGLNNDLGEFMFDVGFTSSDLSHSFFLSLLILGALIFVIRIGENIMLRFMGGITFLLVFLLMAVSIYLIPHWDLRNLLVVSDLHASIDNFLLLLPIYMLSFSYYPAMSSMMIAFREKKLNKHEIMAKSRSVVIFSMLLLFVFIMFFVVSCTLSLSEANLETAIEKNLSVLTMLAEHSKGSPMEYAGPLIGQLALITSFVGTFLGARESARELLKDLREYSLRTRKGLFRFIAFDDMLLLGFLSLIWVVTILHLPILDILGELVAPPIAFFLCILPVWVTYRVPRLKKYRSPALVFTIIVGTLMLFSYFAGKVL